MDDAGWEAVALGDPVIEYTDLPDGLVPNFQAGAVDRLDCQDPNWVRGAIRDHWNENGPPTGVLRNLLGYRRIPTIRKGRVY
ncbi:hypothetical protein OHB12_02285 [Nocardia sp. NBC_01730]|uniref:hypothetical protein n=1 Tax=Nocardia sp. NBC_01730 TaxID=2975998 RepID=UPI002E166075|nr:hypothetical protein OHB12_02285 [Nocardia sp. NBC_01730]